MMVTMNKTKRLSRIKLEVDGFFKAFNVKQLRRPEHKLKEMNNKRKSHPFD